MLFFASGADVRRYFSLFLLSHCVFFFVFKWHCVGEHYSLLSLSPISSEKNYCPKYPTTSRVRCVSTSLLDFELFSFFRFQKSRFFWVHKLLIVHIIHCKLSSKLNYFYSSDGRCVHNFDIVAVTVFFLSNWQTFSMLCLRVL